MKKFYIKTLVIWFSVVLGFFIVGEVVMVGDKNYSVTEITPYNDKRSFIDDETFSYLESIGFEYSTQYESLDFIGVVNGLDIPTGGMYEFVAWVADFQTGQTISTSYYRLAYVQIQNTSFKSISVYDINGALLQSRNQTQSIQFSVKVGAL